MGERDRRRWQSRPRRSFWEPPHVLDVDVTVRRPAAACICTHLYVIAVRCFESGGRKPDEDPAATAKSGNESFGLLFGCIYTDLGHAKSGISRVHRSGYHGRRMQIPKQCRAGSIPTETDLFVAPKSSAVVVALTLVRRCSAGDTPKFAAAFGRMPSSFRKSNRPNILGNDASIMNLGASRSWSILVSTAFAIPVLVATIFSATFVPECVSGKLRSFRKCVWAILRRPPCTHIRLHFRRAQAAAASRCGTGSGGKQWWHQAAE